MANAPMIGMQDCVNFKLISPKRGKLQMSQLYSAYTKSSLSSIPRNVEVILLKNNKINSSIIKDFPSKSTMTSLKPEPHDTIKESFIINNLSLSNKGYGNGFTSNLNRFDNKKALFDKYSPGPGEYNDGKPLINTKLRFRYNSLYANNNPHTLRKKQKAGQTVPGPGIYNIEPLTSRTQDNNTVRSPSFMSKRLRFKDFKMEKLGPGYYYNEYIQNKWNSKMPSSFFRQMSMKDLTLSPERYIHTDRKDIGIGKESLSLSSGLGPGQYDIKSRFDISDNNHQKKKAIHHLLSSSLFYANSQDAFIISPKLKELNKILKEDKMIKSNSMYFNGTLNHNPGPCYYQPNNTKLN